MFREKKDNTALLAALALAFVGGGGAAGGAASSSPCTQTTVTRSYGTFTDMCNGTIKLVVTAGTWGGVVYTAQTQFFAKCSHGQTYNSSNNTCTGTAAQAQYCNALDNSCNAGNNTGTLDGNGVSSIYSTCNSLSLSGKTWRVPTFNESRLLVNCTDEQIPTTWCAQVVQPAIITSLFPGSVAGNYWTSTSHSATDGKLMNFQLGGFGSSGSKTNNTYVRCVSVTP